MIYLKNDIGKTLYEQLYEIIRNDILQGKLRKDQALRPIRTLASELDISNNTVNRAYQMLLSEGYVRAVSGSGYYVEDIDSLLDLGAPLEKTGFGRAAEPVQDSPLKYDFKYEYIDASLFPWSKWRQYMLDAISLESYKNSIGYESNKGSEALRKSLCEYINSNRGINCRPEQVVVCAGTQYGLDIIASILKPAKVAFEEPGYNAVRNLFVNKGCEIIPIPLTQEGVDSKVLKAFKGSADLDLLYITPSHQFPTGNMTSMADRLALVQWAQDNDMYIIENDYDNEFSYGNKRLPALQSLSADNVIYLSTLSKVLSPSLRCAYFVLPSRLVPVYDRLYGYYNSALPSSNQRALSNFINDGHLDKHARKMSAMNKRKYEIFIASMKKLLGDRVEIYNPAGSHVLIKICGCDDQAGLIEDTRKRGIGIYGTKEYWFVQEQAPEDVFLFGYNSMSEQKIKEACHALTDRLEDLLYRQ